MLGPNAPSGALFALALFMGVVVGFAGSAFYMGAEALLGWHRQVGGSLPLVWQTGLSSLISMAFVGVALALVRFAPEASGSGVHEVEAAVEGIRKLRWQRVLPVKLAGGMLAIGSGLALGREGPTIHIGASLCNAASAVCRVGTLDRRALIAAGAAAGLATAFNAPVAAVLFVMEETRRQFPHNRRNFSVVILTALAADVVADAFLGQRAFLPLEVDTVPTVELWLFVLLGIILGAIGVVFNATLLATLRVFERAAAFAPGVLPMLVAALAGALVVLWPDAAGGGEDLVRSVIGAGLGLGPLLALVLVRFVATHLSYGVGIPGGIFAPSLALAASVGMAFAALAELVPIDLSSTPSTFAVAAMAGLFTATVRAPMVGIVLIAELTGTYVLLLPLLCASATAYVVSGWLGGEPIYAQLLQRALSHSHSKRPLS